VQGLPEVIYTSDDEAYLHLPGVIMTERAGEVRYLLSDGLGSVRQAVDETGAVLAYYEFDPYGSPVNDTSGGEPYGFTGEWYESQIELLHLRARWYWPETGTFLSVDPVESEPLYVYVRGNVVNRVDPRGNTPIPWGAGVQYMYSCECGWIDWGGHASPKTSRIRRIADARDRTEDTLARLDTSQIDGQILIDTRSIQGDKLYAVALGIYTKQHEKVTKLLDGIMLFYDAVRYTLVKVILWKNISKVTVFIPGNNNRLSQMRI
jgi:RHS repeat-associated protein